jgi:hypothetical protein
MLDILFRISDGPLGNALIVFGGSFAGLNGLLAQAAPTLEGIPAYLNVAGIAGGLIIAATPLVLRVVDLQRLKDENRKKDEENRRKNHHIRNVIQSARLKDAENRKLREFIVRQSLAHKFKVPEWFYGEDMGPITPDTGDHPLILTPDPDAEPDER